MDDTTLYHWRCSCGARSYRKPLPLANARKEARRHRTRAIFRESVAGKKSRPHEVKLVIWVPKYFKRYVPEPRAECPVCHGTYRVTERGTLWRHRPDRALAAYCPGGGPRAPHVPRPKRPRPELAPNMADFAKKVLEQLKAQALLRGCKKR